MNLNNHKNGFTLAEIVIAMAIIGIITAIALTTLKPAKSAVKYLYMNAYNTVGLAYYNGFVLGYNPFSDKDVDGNAAVHSETKDTGAEILCRALTSYINTKDNVKDSSVKDVNGIAKDYSASCSSTKITSPNADSFTDEKVQFVANNGMKYYISNLIKDDDIKFYLVFIDTNGDKRPNSFDYRKKTVEDDDGNTKEVIQEWPDIYSFALLETGRIVPLGIPEYDPMVLSARFVYFDNEGESLYYKKSLAYYQAKGAAWGYYSNKTEPDEYDESDPLTLNDLIRKKIEAAYAESKIIKDFPELKDLDPLDTASEAPYHCSNEDFESCYIFLDEYRQ